MTKAFSLIELLVVIGIILVLAGMTTAASVVLIRRSTAEQARSLLTKVSTAIDAYRQDRARLPAWQGAWADGAWSWVDANSAMLHAELLGTQNDHRGNPRKGYLLGELAPRDVADGKIVDPWRNALIYYTAPWSGRPPFSGNDTGFELWSAGPDGAFKDLRTYSSKPDQDNLPARPYDPSWQR